MSAQELLHTYPWLVIPVLYVAIAYAVSRTSGWASLARRFRASEPFVGERWSWQSARFGWLRIRYGRCLSVGANQQQLFLAAMLFFRLFHPPLVIPWGEIELETGKILFGMFETAELRIGMEERLRMRIYGKLVNRLRQAAGPGWPLYAVEQMEAQTKQKM